MANKVLLRSVILVRGGKRVSPPLNKAFPLTEDEIKGLTKGVHYRDAVNEDAVADEAEATPLSNSPHVGKPKTNAQGAGQTTAMVNGADGAPRTDTDSRLDGNVTEVTAIINKITDKAELEALRDAEKAGKDRSGALGAIEARVQALSAPSGGDDDL